MQPRQEEEKSASTELGRTHSHPCVLIGKRGKVPASMSACSEAKSLVGKLLGGMVGMVIGRMSVLLMTQARSSGHLNMIDPKPGLP